MTERDRGDELLDEWYGVDEVLEDDQRQVELERLKLVQELDEQEEILLRELRNEAMFGGWT